MSERRDPETQSDALTNKSCPEKEPQQTPRVLGHEKRAEKINLDLLRRLEAKDDDDDEVMLTITDT
ncbi:MAG: hypothetical protein EZS28_023059, partial [Streblomastix strix]